MKRWKGFYPLMRCPKCRRWLELVSHGQYKLRLASPKKVKEVLGEDSASSVTGVSSVRTREGAEE